MSAPDEDPKAPLADRLKLVREIEARIQESGKPKTDFTGWQKAVMVLICAAFFAFWSAWTATWPIPRGKENREKAASFLRQHFPDRTLRPSAKESVTAPVAAVFHVIRNGDVHDATMAIHFAAEQDFGYASPYVIERLESEDPQLRRAARNFLRKMAGKDYGPNAAAWNAWWHGPSRSLFGLVTVGHKTFQLAIPIVSGLIGVVSLFLGTLLKRDAFSALGAGLLVLGWFLFIGTAGMQFVGSFDTCQFGGTEIIYHQGHGIVEGLEDAKVGGLGLWLLLCLAYVAVPFVLMILIVVLHQWWASAKESNPPPASG